MKRSFALAAELLAAANKITAIWNSFGMILDLLISQDKASLKINNKQEFF
jgi:hypothetical protein